MSNHIDNRITPSSTNDEVEAHIFSMLLEREPLTHTQLRECINHNSGATVHTKHDSRTIDLGCQRLRRRGLAAFNRKLGWILTNSGRAEAGRLAER